MKVDSWSIERIRYDIICSDNSVCSGEGCNGDGGIGAADCLLVAFPKFQGSLLGRAVLFKMTLLGAVVAFA